jgi:siroheme synthase
VDRSTPGQVYLVGAGPEEPGLITVRGARLLARAGVVIYDHLAAKILLSYCPREAETIYVGKVADAHSIDGLVEAIVRAAGSVA